VSTASLTLKRGVPILLVIISIASQTAAWSNGGYSSDPADPDYGTHDWIAEHALVWLPMSEKKYIVDNKFAYLYGTELPDNNVAPDGIGDQNLHHVYYHSDHSLQDNATALRASHEFNVARTYLGASSFQLAAKTAGIMSGYLTDVAVFGHVMGSGTDWGAESNHSEYEDAVGVSMTSYASNVFDRYLAFDGMLDHVTAYEATLSLARNTTFGDGAAMKDCVWMNNSYDWSNPLFKDSAGASLNRAVNVLADVLHSLAVDAGYQAHDADAPAVLIVSPTADSAWITASSSVTLGGTAFDEFGVTNVTWLNAANGASGAATGTESWTVAVNLLPDLNSITVTAYDAAGNAGTDILNVTSDTMPPTVTIGSPENNSVLTSATVTVSGSAWDNVAVQKVWISADGVNWAECAGTAPWSGRLTLSPATKWIYAKATDTAGNSNITRIQVTVDLPPSGSSEWWPVALFLVVAVAIGAFLAWMRSRRRSPKNEGKLE